MKIAYILPSFSGDFERPNGGVESAAINLVRGILEADKDVKMFLLYPNTNQIVINVPKRINAVPVDSRFKKVWTYNYPFIGINRYIEKAIVNINPDIVHVQAAPGFFRNFDSKKTFLTLHGVPYIDSSYSRRLANKLKSYILKHIFLRDTKRYKNLIFLVNYSYSLLKISINKNANVFFIPNPIVKTKSQSFYGRNEIPVLFFSGILRPIKNIEGLILASHSLKNGGLKFQLQFAGNFFSQSYETKIKSLIIKYGLEDNIEFLGQLNSIEIQETIKKIDVNLLPSFQEVCPMSIIEAMILGKPSIASSVGGIPEMIFNNYNGYLIPVGNSEELANKIRSILKPEIYNPMSNHCLDMAEIYHFLNIAKQTVDCYRVAINGSQSFF
jgi:glycosyltransferase involved in cell wall biosynthesis